jgi:TfoX/Sxy family transcriptional regulator of competence genes
MAQSHILDLQSLVDRLATRIGGAKSIECKRFFNGAAAYVDGHIFMTLTPVGLALKLPEHDRTVLLAEGARLLQYFPKAPIKKDYVVFPDRIAENDDALAPLVKTSISFVLGSL